MTVQDDSREQELCRIFNLVWDPLHERGGTDAYFHLDVEGHRLQVDVEVKSTTGASVSTARDVGMEHIQKWRGKLWVIGYYKPILGKGVQLRTCLCLTPAQMEPWIAKVEEYIKPDFLLASAAAEHLTLQDLATVCGVKAEYEIEDAKRLHKKQWSAAQYRAAADIVNGRKRTLSPSRMLELLKLRAQYIAERGATVNNPHIAKGFLRQFLGTQAEVKQDWAVTIREIARAYVAGDPSHPFTASHP